MMDAKLVAAWCAGRDAAADACDRLHKLVSLPSPFNGDILAIEERRFAYEMASEDIRALRPPQDDGHG